MLRPREGPLKAADMPTMRSSAAAAAGSTTSRKRPPRRGDRVAWGWFMTIVPGRRASRRKPDVRFRRPGECSKDSGIGPERECDCVGALTCRFQDAVIVVDVTAKGKAS